MSTRKFGNRFIEGPPFPAAVDDAGVNEDILQLLGTNGTGIDFNSSSTAIVASATVDLGAINTRKAEITGTTAISSFGTRPHKERLVRFADSTPLVHDLTKLILPGAADFVTTAGDTCLATSNASGVWTIRYYQRADGGGVVKPLPLSRGGLGLVIPAGTVDKGFYIDSTGAIVFEDRIRNRAFTPAVTAATPGDLTVVYGTVSCTFDKTGPLVWVNIGITFTPTYTTASGDVQITGLPVLSSTNTALSQIPMAAGSTFPWGTNVVALNLVPNGNSQTARILGTRASQAQLAVPITSFTSGTAYTIRFAGMYRAIT